MAKRLCSWCDDPMPWWSKLLFQWTCSNCAYRMSMGANPRVPKPTVSTATEPTDYDG